MSTEFVSLRKQLKGAIGDFLDGEKMECPYTENGLVEIINALSLYREEGKALFPTIFIFDDLEVVLKILVIHEHVKIGEGPKNQNIFLRALKRCAPLAQGGWAIYILRKAGSFEFGLIRNVGNILAISMETALIETGTKELPIIMTHPISEKYVRVAGSSGESMLINFGATKADTEPSSEGINKFVRSLAVNVPDDVKEQTLSFYEMIFADILRAGHGTLAVVISHKKTAIPKWFQDSIVLSPSINVPDKIHALLSTNDIDSNCRLDAYASLINGMMLSDGITIFNTAGAVIAYNAFIKHPSSKTYSQGISGGARRRTFEVLTTMIKRGLVSVLMQSQDGAVLYEEASHEKQ